MTIKTGTDGGGDNNNHLRLSVTNSSGFDLTLSSLVFDVGRRVDNTAAQNLQLRYLSGDLVIPSAPTFLPFMTGALIPVTNQEVADYEDFAFDLSGFADNVLADGESAIYELYVQGASTGGKPVAVDNIAFIGSIAAIPEPSAALFGLLMTSGLGLTVSRRQRR